MRAEVSWSTAQPVVPAGALVAPPASVAHRVMAWIGVMWLFPCLETYTGVIRQTSIEAELYRADVALFGVEPTVWLSKHSTPLLTDYAYRFSDVVWPRHPRLWFRIALGVVASRWISVVYLRHHWFVDIVAGLIVGAAANWLAPILRMRWPRRAHGS